MNSRQTMEEKPGTLAGFLLLGWRLGRPGPPRRRHQLRRLVYRRLQRRWLRYNTAPAPGIDESVARAIWLGSTVRSRSLITGYRRGRWVPVGVRVLARMLGDHAAAMVLGALLAWRWAKGSAPEFARAY
jgi:hypothetical protein